MNSVDFLRILVSVISGEIMVHRIHDDSGEILKTPQEPFRFRAVAFRRRRIGEEIRVIFRVRHGEGGQYAVFAGDAVHRVEIADRAGVAVVGSGNNGIDIQLFQPAAHCFTLAVVGCIRRIVQDVGGQHPQVNRGFVQQEVPTFNAEFTESELFRAELVCGAGGIRARQRYRCRVKVFGVVGIPQLRIAPRSAERKAGPARRKFKFR